MGKIITILFLLCCFYENGHSQTTRTVDSLERLKQTCVETGGADRSPMSCLGKFRDQMDSLMNVVYAKLYNRSSESYQHVLSAEQKEWLAKKIENDQKVDEDKSAIKEDWTAAAIRVFKYESKTAFIRERVKYLISRL